MIQLIQKKIETIYRLEQCPQAQHYLITEQQLSLFEKEPTPQILFSESDDDVSLGIYLGNKIQDSLKKSIKTFSFQDFCVMSEEISHYIYLVWSKSNGKKLNLLDLEIQGEIDKYILAREVYKSNDGWISRIFSDFLLRDHLDMESKERYLEANRLAKKLMQYLHKKKFSKSKTVDWLRHFYRQNSDHRIAMIEYGLH